MCSKVKIVKFFMVALDDPWYIFYRAQNLVLDERTCLLGWGVNREGFNFKLAMVKTCST